MRPNSKRSALRSGSLQTAQLAARLEYNQKPIDHYRLTGFLSSVHRRRRTDIQDTEEIQYIEAPHLRLLSPKSESESTPAARQVLTDARSMLFFYVSESSENTHSNTGGSKMKMQQIIIEGTEDLINDQEAKRMIKQRTQKMEEAGQFNEHMQPPEGFDCIKQIFDGDVNATWYWLTVPNDALDGAEPLALLREGEVARVEAAAKGYLQGDFA